jgi:hypothetical protein
VPHMFRPLRKRNALPNEIKLHPACGVGSVRQVSNIGASIEAK